MLETTGLPPCSTVNLTRSPQKIMLLTFEGKAGFLFELWQFLEDVSNVKPWVCFKGHLWLWVSHICFVPSSIALFAVLYFFKKKLSLRDSYQETGSIMKYVHKWTEDQNRSRWHASPTVKCGRWCSWYTETNIEF